MFVIVHQTVTSVVVGVRHEHHGILDASAPRYGTSVINTWQQRTA